MGNFRRENTNSGFNRGGDRDSDRGGRGGGFGRRDSGGSRGYDRPEMFQATCDQCGKSCQVPFRPTQGKPVYCSDCFGDKKHADRGGERPQQSFRGSDNSAQLDAISAKLDKILSILSPEMVTEVNEPESEPETEPELETVKEPKTPEEDI